MRIIPKASKVKVTFYKGITIADVVIGILALAVVAIAVSSNFAFKWYFAASVVCAVAPLYMTVGDQRLYVQIAYLLRYLFSKKGYSGDDVGTLVPYREAKDGIVLNKDGSAFGAIEIEPINFPMLGEDRQNEIIDYCYARVLNTVGQDEEWVLQMLEMPIVLDGQIKGELARVGNLGAMVKKGELSDKEFIQRCDATQARLIEVDAMNSDGGKKQRFFLSLVGINTNLIADKLDQAVSTLEAGGIKSHRLTSQELLLMVKAGYGHDYDPRDEMKAVAKPEKLSFGIASAREGDISETAMAITRYPLQVPNGWAERLFSLTRTKVSMRMKPIEKSKAIKRIDNAILEVETKRVGKESEYQEDESHLETLRTLLEDIQQNNETLFDTTIIITAYDEPKSSQNRRAVKDALREMGFGFSELVGRQMDGYVSSMVSQSEFTKMAHGIQTSSLAAAFPFSDDSVSDEGGLLMGGGDTPDFVDFFKRDLVHVNSNLIIVGQSGSGKSYATKTLLTNLSTDGAKIYVLDPESEYGALARNLGGSVIDAADGNKGRINPFEIMTTMDDMGGESNSFYSHLQFLEEFYRMVLQGISQDALETLNKLTEETYAAKGIKPGVALSKLKSEDYPTFDDLGSLVDKKIKEGSDAYESSCLRTVENWLSRFREGGRDSALWDGYTTFSPKESFVTFDFQRLLYNHNEVTANAQMLLLLRWLENEVIRNRDYNAKEKESRKIVIAIDEAHMFIDERYPIALDFMYQMAKRIRKYDGMLAIISQNIRDFLGMPEVARKSSAIVSVSQYSMIFALPPNDMNDLVKLYENGGGINETEKEIIIHNPRGTCFLISSPNERNTLPIEANKHNEALFAQGG